MTRAAVGLCVMLVSSLAIAQLQMTPIRRYNTISESIYLLQRCGELNQDRRTWLQGLRDQAKKQVEWSPSQWAEHDAALKTDFDQHHAAVPKEKCVELATTTDHERKMFAPR
jgi:hypothetical protein